MKKTDRSYLLTRMLIVVAALMACGTSGRAALVDFYFTGATTDPLPGGAPAVGHLIYDDLNQSISDLTFSIGGEAVVSYTRDTFGNVPVLVSRPGERQLFLSDFWVAGSRSLFFLGLDPDQAFADFGRSIAGNGKWSDIAPVPEPSTVYAGMLLLIPMGWSVVRRYRERKR